MSESPLPKRQRTPTKLFTFDVTPDSSASKSTSSLEDFVHRYKDRHFFFYTDTLQELSMFVEIRYHDVINPSDTGPDGLSSWVLNPCTDCINRKDCSSFSTQLLRVNFQEIKKGNIPESLPRKFVTFGKHAALAVEYSFANGFAKSVMFHLLNTAQESWLCRNHFRIIHMYNPGTYHEIGGVDIMLRRDDDLEFFVRGCPDLTVRSDHQYNMMLLVGEAKKGWRDDSPVYNCIESDNLQKSQLGQLLTYLVGHAVQSFKADRPLHIKLQPMLGMYMEGSKVVLVRAQLIEELPNYFKLRLGICPAGDRALDLLTEVGASRIAETMIRFVSNVKLSPRDDESTTTSILTTASNSPS